MINFYLLSFVDQMLVTLFVFVVVACVGSFLNVVIYRLPLMMQIQWKKDAKEFLELEQEEPSDRFNLAFPNSHCPSCNTAIRIWQNIPILSYLLLRGRCANCSVLISYRYPFVELFTAIVGVLLLLQFGLSEQFAALLFASFILVCLVGIDIDHMLLPDILTLPLLWFGLLLNVYEVFTPLQDAVIGAVVGYMSLWSFYWMFKIFTGKEGMGAGDFKLLAAIGAIGGWQILLDVILLSSIVGAIYGVIQSMLLKNSLSKPMPYGPFLAAAGWLMLVYPGLFSLSSLLA